MALTTVLFDIGNVCVDWDPRALYAPLIEDPDRLDWFMKTVITMDWHKEHDRGRSFKEGVRIRSAEFPEVADLIALYDTCWDDTITGPIEGTLALIDRLYERGVEMYGLTNFSAEKYYGSFTANYPFTTERFKGVLVSGEEGLIKPDPAIFKLTIERFALNPGETLFVDDRMDNIVAAEALGFQGHQFTSAERLEDDLKVKGFL